MFEFLTVTEPRNPQFKALDQEKAQGELSVGQVLVATMERLRRRRQFRHNLQRQWLGREAHCTNSDRISCTYIQFNDKLQTSLHHG